MTVAAALVVVVIAAVWVIVVPAWLDGYWRRDNVAMRRYARQRRRFERFFR